MFCVSESKHPDSRESRQPPDGAFRQQRLPAWQPVLNATSVLPAFFALSVVCIPIGVTLLVASRSVVEFQLDYTDCESREFVGMTCADLRTDRERMASMCTCQINITLEQSFEGDVYVYYGLSNFFQNHRRYVKSRDDSQLFGNPVDAGTVSSDCAPFSTVIDSAGVTRPVAPCGAVANSFFNDTYTLAPSTGGAAVPVLRTGIAWDTDHRYKFNNPGYGTSLNSAFNSSIRPTFWQVDVTELDPSSIENNGYKHEPLIVWMRTAAFSQFRKVYGRLNRVDPDYTNGLPNGDYSLAVDYNFPVKSFGGRKRFILSTASWSGGRSDFLGIAYLCLGVVSFVIAISLCTLHYHERRMREMKVHRDGVNGKAQQIAR